MKRKSFSSYFYIQKHLTFPCKNIMIEKDILQHVEARKQDEAA